MASTTNRVTQTYHRLADGVQNVYNAGASAATSTRDAYYRASSCCASTSKLIQSTSELFKNRYFKACMFITSGVLLGYFVPTVFLIGLSSGYLIQSLVESKNPENMIVRQRDPGFLPNSFGAIPDGNLPTETVQDPNRTRNLYPGKVFVVTAGAVVTVVLPWTLVIAVTVVAAGTFGSIIHDLTHPKRENPESTPASASISLSSSAAASEPSIGPSFSSSQMSSRPSNSEGAHLVYSVFSSSGDENSSRPSFSLAMSEDSSNTQVSSSSSSSSSSAAGDSLTVEPLLP